MSVALAQQMDFPAAEFDGLTGEVEQLNDAWLRTPELLELSGELRAPASDGSGQQLPLSSLAPSPRFADRIRETVMHGPQTMPIAIANGDVLVAHQIKFAVLPRSARGASRPLVLAWLAPFASIDASESNAKPVDINAALVRYGSLISEPWAYVDAAGIYRYVSPQSLALLGPDAQGGIVGMHYKAWAIDRPGRSVGVDSIERALTGEALSYDRLRYDHRFGEERWHRVQMRPDLDGNGKLLGIFIVSQDIQARRMAEAQARSAKNLLDLHLRRGPMIAIELDQNFRIITWSQRAEELFGYSAAEAIGSTLRELNTVVDIDSVEAGLRAMLDGRARNSWNDRGANRNKRGDAVWVDWYNSVVTDPVTGETTLLSLGVDVTQELDLKQRLSTAVMHDELTGVLNRKTLARLMTGKLLQGVPFALLTLDLDSFKQVNDYRGHPTGDQLLITLTERMRSALEPGERMARLGGDEFALLLDLGRHTSDEVLVERANVILKYLAAPVVIGFEFAITASAGIAKSGAGVQDAEALLTQADMAMHRAKEAGGNRAVIYEPSIGQAVRDRLEMCESLRQAVRKQTIDVHYQPIFDTANDRIVGAEALARWGLDGGNAVEPSVFVGLAEEKGFIHELWQCVMRKACTFAASINQIGGVDVCPVSVNVSPLQLNDPRFDRYVLQILKDTRCMPTWIALEVTESASLGERTSAATLRRLTAMGIACSVDDFGTGYSNFGHLRRLSLATLKIDKSFVRDLSHGDVSIVSAIVPMAHSLGLKVVAEGVEFVEELIALKAIGCDRYQGFVASAPIRGDEFVAMLNHDRELHALSKRA